MKNEEAIRRSSELLSPNDIRRSSLWTSSDGETNKSLNFTRKCSDYSHLLKTSNEGNHLSPQHKPRRELLEFSCDKSALLCPKTPTPTVKENKPLLKKLLIGIKTNLLKKAYEAYTDLNLPEEELVIFSST